MTTILLANERKVTYEPLVLSPSVQEYFANPENHNRLLSDRIRLESFKKAIDEVVKPGDVVMDIGAGTGILSQYAIEAGAKKIYLVEENENILQKAKERLSCYQHQVSVEFINARSTELSSTDISEKANVIISETIGSMGINEGIIDTLNDARRFLKKEGVTIPSELSLFCAPYYLKSYECEPQYQLLVRRGSAADLILINTFYCLGKFSFSKKIPDRIMSKLKLSSMTLQHHGLCCWFEAKLSSKVKISNSPEDLETSWGCVVLPGCTLEYPTEILFEYSHKGTLKMFLVSQCKSKISPVFVSSNFNWTYKQLLSKSRKLKMHFSSVKSR